MNSGIGPRRVLERANIPVLLEMNGVGKHLLDHLYVNMEFEITTELQSSKLVYGI